MQALIKRYLSQMTKVFKSQKIKATVTKIDKGARFVTFWLRLKNSTELDKATKVSDSIALASGVSNVLVRRTGAWLLYDFALPEKYWQFYTMKDTNGWQVGFASGGIPVEFSFDYPNTLFVGSPGSGKSVTMEACIFAAARNLSTEQFQVALCDPHASIKTHNLAHYLCQPATDEQSIHELIAHFYDEFMKRKRLGSQKVAELPRMLLAIDEAHESEVLGVKGNHNKENLQRVAELVKGGRKFKINIFIATQKPGEQDLPGIFGVVASRYIGAVDSARTASHLSGSAGVEAHQLTGKGDMMYVNNSNIVRFQSAVPTGQDYLSLPKQDKLRPIPVSSLGVYSYDQWDAQLLGHYIKNNPEYEQVKSDYGISELIHKHYKEFAKAIRES